MLTCGPLLAVAGCTSEYAIARLNGRIVNSEDPAVRAVSELRQWPTNVAEYMEMMRPDNPRRIRFTNGADEDVVAFNFFRMCFGPSHSFFPEKTWEELHVWARPLAWDAPSSASARKYYVVLAMQPPPLTPERRLRFLSSLFAELKDPLLTIGGDLLARGQHPICFSDAEPTRLCALLRDGRAHSLVWCATGVGWEAIDATAGVPSIGFDTLLALVPTLRSPPAILILCL
ncbi:hypothetical protein OAO87_04350, partial [bacterium]|nr:hypothetical protein [bacterium]